MSRFQTDLFNVSLQVFEDLGFLLPSTILNEEQKRATLDAGVTVEFSGPANGMVLLAVSGQVLSALAANMLGEDLPPPELQQQDALREVANVICGNLLPHIGGPDAVFDIRPPQIGDPRHLRDRIQGQLAAEQLIGVEEGQAKIQLFLQDGTSSQEG